MSVKSHWFCACVRRRYPYPPTSGVRGYVDVGEVLHQQQLLRLLGGHQLGVLVRAGGERLLQVGLLLVQRGHVRLVILLARPAIVIRSDSSQWFQLSTRQFR